MDCNYSIFKNLLGVYRVIIDSVLDNNNRIDVGLQKRLLTEYFRDFQYTENDEDVEQFLTEVLDSVSKAYEMVKNTLDGRGMPIQIDEASGLTLTDNINSLINSLRVELNVIFPEPQRTDNTDYDLAEADEPAKELQIKKLDTGELTRGVVNPSSTGTVLYASERIDLKLKVSTSHELIETQSDIEANYYSSASTAHNSMRRDFFSNIFEARIFDVLSAVPDKRIDVLNKSIREYKNRLFKSLVADTSYANKELYDVENGNQLIKLSAVLAAAEIEFNNMNSGTGIEVSDLLHWSLNKDKTTNPHQKKLDKYNAFVTLKHFDAMINDYSKGLVQVKEHLKDVETTENKYMPMSTARMRTNWTDADSIAATEETTKIFSSYIETLPIIDDKGNISSSRFLTTGQLNFTFSKLRTEVTGKNPTGSIIKAIQDTLENHVKNPAQSNIKENDFKALITLYLNVYRNSESDKVLLNTRLRTVLNKFSKPSLFERFYRKHPVRDEINYVDLVSANIMKVDTIGYSEIVYDFNEHSQVYRSMYSKMIDKQSYILRGLGRLSTSRTAEHWDSFKSTYKVDVVDGRVQIQLDGATLYYNPQNGDFYDGEKAVDVKNWRPLEIIPAGPDASFFLSNTQGISDRYKNYHRITWLFDNLLHQPLSSDNYSLLNLLRDETDGADPRAHGNHLKSLLTLLGNSIYTSWLNTRSINGNINLPSADIATSVSGIINSSNPGLQYRDVWDESNSRFKIDIGKHGAGALLDYSTALNTYYQTNLKAVTMNLEGNMVPTYTIMNAINRYMDTVQEIAKTPASVRSPLKTNLFVKNNNLISSLEKRTGVRNSAGDVVSPTKLNVKELLKSSILVEFLYNRTSNNPVRFQPTNYADKSGQVLIGIDQKKSIEYFDAEGKSLGTKLWSELTSDDFKNTYHKTMGEYYTTLSKNLLDDYRTLLTSNALEEAYIASTEVLGDALMATFVSAENGYKLEDFPESYRDDPRLISELEVFNKIRTAKFNTLGSVNNVFELLSGDTIINAFREAGITWVTNIHFERNPITKKYGINTSLQDLINSFTRNKEESALETERLFAKSLVDEEFTIDLLDSQLAVNKTILNALDKYPELNRFLDQTSQRIRIYNGDLRGKDFELNPLLKDYLWQQNLVARNFQLLTVGSPLGHPAKKVSMEDIKGEDGIPVATQLLAQRLVAQNKRMVIHQATMHPYTLNLINGVPFKSRVAFIADPQARVFSPSGLLDDIDAVDGSSLQDPLETLLQNNSLIDQRVGTQHKSIAGTIEPRLGAAGLTKHAAFTMTNRDIQGSEIYRRLIAKSLRSTKYNDIDGIPLKLDITRDYNGNYIDIGSMFDEIAFMKQDVHNLPGIINGTLVKLKGIRSGEFGYEAIYETTDPDLEPITVPVQIENLYDLWVILGAEHSVTYDSEDVGKLYNNDSELDGYVTSDRSWEALAEYVNRVGFWYNSSDTQTTSPEGNTIKTIGNVTSPELYRDLKEAVKKYVHDPYTTNYNVSIDTGLINQKNIIQPFKINHIGSFTFFSGQKVGMKNGMTLEEALDPSISLFHSLESNLHKGIQLNADHESDGSEVTEQTQVISTMSFTGDTPEYADNVFNAISGYISLNLDDIIDAANHPFNEHSKATIYKIIKKQVVKAFKDKDISGLANSIVQEIKAEVESGINEFKIPVSSADMYNTINTSIANMFTKEGIRRKMDGMAAVAEPYSQLVKYRTLPDGTVVTEAKYKQWKLKNPDEIEVLNNISPNEIEIYDTLVDPEGNTIELIDPTVYVDVKRRMLKNPTGWSKNITAPRDLRPLRHSWDISGIGRITHYDTALGALPSYRFRLEKAVNKFNNNKNDSTKIALDLAASEYNEVLAQSGLGFAPFDPSLEGSTVKWSKTQINTHKNALNEYLKRMYNEQVSELPITITSDQLSNVVLISGVRAIDAFTESGHETIGGWLSQYKPLVYVDNVNIDPGEIVSAFPHRSAFGLSKEQDVSDVTLEYFKSQIDKNSKPIIRQYDMFLKDNNGEHIYVLIDGSANHRNAPQLTRVQLDTIVENGITYKIDALGQKMYPLGYRDLYRGQVDGKVVDFVIVKDLDDIRDLSIMYKGRNAPYDTLVANYGIGSAHLPLFMEMINADLLQGDINILARAYELLRFQSDEDLRDIVSELDTMIYNEEWLDNKIASLDEKVNSYGKRRVPASLVNDLEKLRATKTAITQLEDDSDRTDIIKQTLLNVGMDMYLQQQLRFIEKSQLDANEYINKILQKLQEKQEAYIDRVNSKKALKKWNSFQKSLEVTGARIPGQDFQSYSALKIVGFIEGKGSVIRVPPAFQWTTGGDFDIDKVFMMMYSVGKNSTISGWSRLWKDSSLRDLDTSLKSPVPNKRTFASIETNRLDGLNDFQISIINRIAENPEQSVETLNSNEFEALINGLNLVNRLDSNVIPLGISATTASESDTILRFINWYFNDSFNVRDAKKAMLNGIFHNVKASISDIRNVINAYSPVNFGDYTALAEKSEKGKQMKRMSYENPVDIYRAQVANMVGKDVIGIAASAGLKSYSAAAMAMIDVLKGKTGPAMIPYEVPYRAEDGSIKMTKGTGLKGINFTGNMDKLYTYVDTILGDVSDAERQIIKTNLAIEMRQRGSVALDLSSILSAATDNAKELILSRINAGPDTASYYLAASMLGVSTDVMFEVMTSKTTEGILRLAKRDVFNNSDIRFNSALAQIANNYLNSKTYFTFNQAANLVLALEDMTVTVNGSSTKVSDYIKSKMDDDTDKVTAYDNLRTVPFSYIQFAASNLDTGVLLEGIKKLENIELLSNLELSAMGFMERRPRNLTVDMNTQDYSNFNQEMLGDMSLFDDSDLIMDDTYLLDDVSGDFADEFSINRVKTKPLGMLMARYLQDYDLYINSVKGAEPEDYKGTIINVLETIGTFKSDIELLAKTLSVNQGIRNTHYDLKNYTDILVEYIVTKIPASVEFLTKEYPDEIYTYDGNIRVSDNDKLYTAVLVHLADDPEFLNVLKDTFEGNGSMINVIDVISRVPHMWSMLRTAVATYNIYDKISIKSRTINKLLNSDYIQRNRNNYFKLSNYVDDVVIASILNSLSDSMANFTIRKGDVINTQNPVAAADTIISIKNLQGRKDFIDWFENTLIPNLKAGIIVSQNGEKTVDNGSIAANEFIKRLTLDVKKDVSTGEPYYYYRIPINLTNVLTDNELEQIDVLKAYFSRLKNVSYDGKPLIDLFFLYNLIVNKGKVSSTSLSPLLNSVSGGYVDNTIMSTYVRALGEMDYNETYDLPLEGEDGYRIEDLFLRGVGEEVSSVPVVGTDIESYPKSIVLKQWNELERKSEAIPFILNPMSQSYERIMPKAIDKYLNVTIGDVNSTLIQDGLRLGRASKLRQLLKNNMNYNLIDC